MNMDTKRCEREGRRGRTPLNHFMKTRFTLGLCVVLGAGSMAVRGADNPAQAAARAALEQKLSRPDAWEPQPLTSATAPATPAVAMAEPPVKFTAKVTGPVSWKTATSPTAPASATPMVAAVPRLLLLAMAFLTVLVLAMLFLLLKLLRQNSRAYDSNPGRSWNV